MIKSMTGFGKEGFENSKFVINIEIKSLNSKFLDASIKLPREYSDKELEVRTLLSNTLQRGKINLLVEFERKEETEAKITINKSLLEVYYKELKSSAEMLKASENDLFRLALQMPDVILNHNDNLGDEEEWTSIVGTLNKAIAQCDKFRNEEGKFLAKNILENLGNIRERLKQIETRDPQRISNLRIRLQAQLNELIDKNKIDQNRLEQELIYYIEKLDINEEKVRLRSHLDYFIQTMAEKEPSGKKLGFISQEIGREINTIGSKANNAEVQKFVVEMKNELEEIKEQLNNLL